MPYQKTLNGTAFTKSMESATRKKVDQQLMNLGWHIDEESPDCNVFTERPKTEEQKEKLGGANRIMYSTKVEPPSPLA